MFKLEFKKINKIYPNGFQAVYDFDFSIEDGEFIVLVGPSGCGKSTILRMVAGLEEISGGELILDEKIINKFPPAERDIAVVFQDYALYGHMSVYDNVGMSLRVKHEKDTLIYDKVQEASEMLELSELLNRLPGQLSGGQKQRVALARSVVRQPKVYLMDEPLSNLDQKLRTSIRTEIIKLQKKLNVTTIYVTHDQTEAMTMADRMVVLKDGVVQQIGTPEQIYNEPCNIFVAGFIGAPQMNFLEGKVSNGHFEFGDFKLGLPETIAAQMQEHAGKEIIMGIRPEEFSLGEPSPYTLTGELENSEFMGNHYILYVRFGENIVTCRIEGTDGNFKDRLDIKFGMNKIYFYDKQTSQLLLHGKAGV